MSKHTEPPAVPYWQGTDPLAPAASLDLSGVAVRVKAAPEPQNPPVVGTATVIKPEKSKAMAKKAQAKIAAAKKASASKSAKAGKKE